MAELTGELFEILIKGPSPFGFRLHGGDGNPLIVAKLRARGKSRGAGLNEGDVVLGINGVSCQTISLGIAMTLIETAKEDLLRLHLYRGSTDQESLSTAYGAIADQLRPASPGLTSSLLSSIIITPSTGVESPFEAVPAPPSAVSDAEKTERLTSYAKQEVTSSVEAFATQTTTTETRHSVGRVTVTMATRDEAEEEEEIKGSEGGTEGTSSAMFHVPKIKSQQPLRWAPKGTTTTAAAAAAAAAATTTTTTTTSELLFQANKSITIELDADKENLAPNKQTEIVEIAKFPAEGYQQQQQQQQQFKATKQWIWQPPTGQPEPSEPAALPTDSEVPDPPPLQESQPQEKPIEAERTDGGGTSSPEDLSPHLVHILTTEATRDDDCTSHRKKKKIFADSSFYDDPEHKYPTIEEQIRLARQVALSLSTPDNATARGQQMFRKQKQKAADDGGGGGGGGLGFRPPLPPSPRLMHGTTSGDQRLFYNPAPWRAPQTARKVEAAEEEEEYKESHADPEAFARNRSVFETSVEVQRRELPWKKALSSSITTSPQLYAGLTKDLKSATGGRGAKLFSQKRAEALKEEQEQEAGDWFGEGETNGFGETGDHATPDREEAPKAVPCPWESKTGGQSRRLTPWQTAPAAANDAEERGTDRERADDVPSFIAEKIPSLSYRPVKFHVA